MKRLKTVCRYCGKSGDVVRGAHERCLRAYVRDYCRERRAIARLGAKRAGIHVPEVGDVFVPSYNGTSHRCAPFKCTGRNGRYVTALDAAGEQWKFLRSTWDFSVVN